MLANTQTQQAASWLGQGELVAFPTETVYGLGADATNPTACRAVYQAKGRPSVNPLIVHVDGPQMVWQYAQKDERAEKLMTAYWPGPLTIILKLKPQTLSTTVTGGLTTCAFRMPDNAATLTTITQLGRPIVGPSANTSGKPSPTTAQHVYHDLNGKIKDIIDDGPTRVGLESTVIDLTVKVPTILQKKVHFAVMAQQEVLDNLDLAAVSATFSLGDSLQSASHLLFAGLRQFDLVPEIQYILAQGQTDSGLGSAYMNRLSKSAGNQHFH